MELATVTATLSSIKTAIDIAKALKDTDLSLEKAETKLQLAELVSALADAKIQIAEFQDLLLSKEQENKALMDKLSQKEALRFDGKMYWITQEDATEDGPFCQKCNDANEKLIRLQDWGDYWICMNCDKSYDKS
jgi:hypothetical protein